MLTCSCWMNLRTTSTSPASCGFNTSSLPPRRIQIVLQEGSWGKGGGPCKSETCVTGGRLKTVVVVSHDHGFLEAVTTDVVVFEDVLLQYYPCGMQGYCAGVTQVASRKHALLDVSTRQEKAAVEAAEHMQQQG